MKKIIAATKQPVRKENMSKSLTWVNYEIDATKRNDKLQVA